MVDDKLTSCGEIYDRCTDVLVTGDSSAGLRDSMSVYSFLSHADPLDLENPSGGSESGSYHLVTSRLTPLIAIAR